MLLNLPRSVAGPVRTILALLPERVAQRVLVLGEGEEYDFSTEIDADARGMLDADQLTLMRHAGAPLAGLTPPEGHRPGYAQPGAPSRPLPHLEAAVVHAVADVRGGADEAEGGGGALRRALLGCLPACAPHLQHAR